MKRESRDALITWRGFGNTNKKRIQKVKEIVETDKWKEKGEKKRRKKKEEDKPSFLSKVVRNFS